VTNNPKFIGYHNFLIDFNEDGFLDVLYRVRNLIHKNYKILTHPLYGNITPTTTLYRSIVVEKVNYLDMESVYLIEDSIQKVERIIKLEKHRIFPDSIKEDLEFIDYTLIKETLDQIL
jgi:hypothetical protein